MNWARVAMAGFAGLVSYFLFGGLCSSSFLPSKIPI
jgi:hypothetical protein